VFVGFHTLVGLAAALAVENLVGTNPETGPTGKQADNKKTSKSKVAGKRHRTMLNPLYGQPILFFNRLFKKAKIHYR
jgi:hypothetical protein